MSDKFSKLMALARVELGLQCHVQLEERVPSVDQTYQNSGHVLLGKLLGANLHYYDQGEDEASADRQLNELAHSLREQGRQPYVISLAPGHPPLGALGYVVAAQEIVTQAEQLETAFDEIVVASGSGHTHAGLLFGLRALGNRSRVSGICVRREAGAQHSRIGEHCLAIASLLGMDSPVTEADIHLQDDFLARRATAESTQLPWKR